MCIYDFKKTQKKHHPNKKLAYKNFQTSAGITCMWVFRFWNTLYKGFTKITKVAVAAGLFYWWYKLWYVLSNECTKHKI